MIAKRTKVLIAENPRAVYGDRQAAIRQLRDLLIDRGYSVEVCRSLAQVQEESVRWWQEGQLRTVVSAGGDGTAAELANRLPAEIPLLIFPLGTENLLAKYLGINASPAEACHRIMQCETRRVDAGLANGRLFLIMAGCGFDAEVVREMHSTRRGRINRWSYAWPIIQTLRHYRFPGLRVRESRLEMGRAAVERTAAWAFVFNVPRYAANLPFCPSADPHDGLLDVCTFRLPGRLQGLSYFANLLVGRHRGLRDFQHTTSRSLTIDVEPGGGIPVPYQLDGDPGGFLPVEIQILAERLNLVV
jgi:diacylglycerol kinase family enzyme